MATKKLIDFTAWGSKDRYKLAKARGVLSLVENHFTGKIFDYGSLNDNEQHLFDQVKRVLKETADKPVHKRKLKR